MKESFADKASRVLRLEAGSAQTQRYRANGLVVGVWNAELDTLVLLDGTRCKAEPEVKLRRWLEKEPARAQTMSRWVVYPRTVKDGSLEFFVVGQRNALAGENDKKIDREIDRFIFSGTVLNVRVQKQKLVLRIGRNESAPSKSKARFHPAWRTRTVFLDGTAGVPQGAVGSQVTVTCRREGSRMVAFHWKPNPVFIRNDIEIGIEPVLALPWPWRPSSQTLWKLCKDWNWDPAELTGDADVDLGLLEHTSDQLLQLHQILDVGLFHLTPKPEDPLFAYAKGDEREERRFAQDHHRLHMWMQSTQRFLSGLPESERIGLLRVTQFIPLLVAAGDRYEKQVSVTRVDGDIHLNLERCGLSVPIRGGPRTKLLRLLCLAAPVPAPKPETMNTQKEGPAGPIPTEEQVALFTERLNSIAKAYGLSNGWVRMRVAGFINGERV